MKRGSTSGEQKVQQAMLTAAGCGSFARLDVGEPVLHALVDLVNGLPPPLDPAAPRRVLHIRVDRPAP